jgi:aminoglycoside phosphotransferase (APT) family kinase protein
MNFEADAPESPAVPPSGRVPALPLTVDTLRGFLAAVAPDRPCEVLALRPISGGYSRDTAVAEVRWSDNAVERFVLRSDPPAGEGVFVSDRDIEWRVLEALSRAPETSVRIPAARWYDSSGAHFGTKTIVSEFFDGQSLQDVARKSTDLGQTQDVFVNIAEDIHRTPLEVLPAELPVPLDWDTYMDGVVDSVARVAHGEFGGGRPALRYAASRLRSFRPEAVPLTLVHGDLQPSNVLLGRTGAVVIDWEFAHIGDPREDLGYYMQMPILPNLYLADTKSFLARYRDRAGLTRDQVNEETVEYFMMLGTLRVIEQMLSALDATAQGKRSGIMATYLINALSLLYTKFFDACRRIG